MTDRSVDECLIEENLAYEEVLLRLEKRKQADDAFHVAWDDYRAACMETLDAVREHLHD